MDGTTRRADTPPRGRDALTRLWAKANEPRGAVLQFTLLGA